MSLETKMKLVTLIMVINIAKQPGNVSVFGSTIFAGPCIGTKDILLSYLYGDTHRDKDNEYNVFVKKKLPAMTDIRMKFDSNVSITADTNCCKLFFCLRMNMYVIRVFRPVNDVTFKVKGSTRGSIPYFQSLQIRTHNNNTQEYCEHPNVGFLDSYVQIAKHIPVKRKASHRCGRRKVKHIELIVNGEITKSGDWPWHVAIYQLNRANIKYICGGTLISKTTVLTAAHCTTIRGIPVIPEYLSVVLGKHNLIGGNLEAQEREVHSIIVHEDFAPKQYFNNDIALMKLKTEAMYNDYVQPACIWHSELYERLPYATRDFGTVVGWGFDQSENLALQLRQSTVPMVATVTCMQKNPLFYANALSNNKKFCAGWANGTSACNGDSGGGFLVFVPDFSKDDSPNAVGAYYVRGIVSMTVARKNVALCDPYQYVVFTDVEKYSSWIQNHLDT